VREVDVHRAHVTSTRVCAAVGSIGVPVGTQVEEPVMLATGTPPASTRVAPTSHCPVTHGGGGVPGSAQPAVTYGEGSVTTGWPVRSTRGNGAIGVAGPAWMHITTAPRWRAGAGIRRPSARPR